HPPNQRRVRMEVQPREFARANAWALVDITASLSDIGFAETNFPMLEENVPMKSVRDLARLSLLVVLAAAPGRSAGVHVWEKQELVLTSTGAFANPYTRVTVWVDLTGPGFKKRVYGFWAGERTFRVRVLAAASDRQQARLGTGRRNSIFCDWGHLVRHGHQPFPLV